MLHIESTTESGVTVLRLDGDIDEDGVKKLRMSMVDSLQEHHYDIVVNLNNVVFISYMGIGVLVEQLRQIRHHGGDLKLCGVNMHTDRLLRVVGVTSLFQRYATEKEAVAVCQEAA